MASNQESEPLIEIGKLSSPYECYQGLAEEVASKLSISPVAGKAGLQGEKGDIGAPGQDGEDGRSPVITPSDERVSITVPAGASSVTFANLPADAIGIWGISQHPDIAQIIGMTVDRTGAKVTFTLSDTVAAEETCIVWLHYSKLNVTYPDPS